MAVHDVIVDTLFDESVEDALKVLGAGKLLRDKDGEPFLLGDFGYLVVRIKDRDPTVFARELERRVSQMRIVDVVDRTPEKKEA